MTGQNRDYELDRLKDEQERLFKIKQQAWEKQNDAWESLKSLRSRSGPRIDYLNSEQQRLFDSMKDSFERASYAFSSKDFVGAKLHSDDGKECKAQLPAIVDERRRLVAELRAAGDVQKNAVAEFRLAKEEFEQASRNFKARLEVVKSQNRRKRDDKKEIARKAGVPSQYLDDVWVSTQSDGTINIYFGGAGKPNGPGHGHYTMDSSGRITYKREPLEDHGSKNYTGSNGVFNGIPAKIVMSDSGNSDRIDVYFGGIGEPDGPGHNHVAVIKDNIRFWRENGQIIIDEKIGTQ